MLRTDMRCDVIAATDCCVVDNLWLTGQRTCIEHQPERWTEKCAKRQPRCALDNVAAQLCDQRTDKRRARSERETQWYGVEWQPRTDRCCELHVAEAQAFLVARARIERAQQCQHCGAADRPRSRARASEPR